MISEFVYAFLVASVLFFVVGQCSAHDADGLVKPGGLGNNPCYMGGYASGGIVKSPFCDLQARIKALEARLEAAGLPACPRPGLFWC